ncbi:CoA transferase [Bradyrhizobium diversitatis]|uniref:CoA transferase n=1 Tax=Bradyrhizobium diversitatis TaxID=2755406 RepID=UPI00289888A5|nr:CoA transferase [Bradyrhizobium diversitatis]
MSENFRPLEEFRAKMSHMVVGPSCGIFLTILGAEVIKIEPLTGRQNPLSSWQAARCSTVG